MTARADAPSPPNADVVEAIWRVQGVDFTFSSPRSYYACYALKAKIRAILRAVGAHHAIRVQMACNERALVNSARAHIYVALPAEATEASVTAATTFSRREELAARVRGVALPTPADIERFPAAWQQVSLSGQSSLRLDPGDCDLLRDLNQQVFPKLGIRSNARLGCFASATRVKPDLQVEALVRVAGPTAGAMPRG